MACAKVRGRVIGTFVSQREEREGSHWSMDGIPLGVNRPQTF
jgi:hypothetical protein